MPRDDTRCRATMLVFALAATVAAAGCRGVEEAPPALDPAAPEPPGLDPDASTVLPPGRSDSGEATADARSADDATGATDGGSALDASGAEAAPPVRLVVWNGDDVAGGAGWATPNTNAVTVDSAVAHGGKAVFWNVVPQGVPWSEWGWNWKAWQKPGTDASKAHAFTFFLKVTGHTPPDDIVVTLRSAITDKYAHQPPAADGLRGVRLHDYEPSFADGAWHGVTIPMADILSADSANDFREIYEVFMGAGGSDYQLYLDDLGFLE